MKKERYQKLFEQLKLKKEGAFIPFLLLGDPNPNISLQIIETVIQAGADALELGIPFSDPIADGPVIQNSVLRAFSSGITIEYCFFLLKLIRIKYPKIPIGLLVYANLIFQKKIDYFYFLCKKIEIDSILIPDVPIEESEIFINISQKYDISSIFICPPNANDYFLKLISSYSNAYIYLLCRSGVTGSIKKNDNQLKLLEIIKKLKKYHSVPTIQGFGIENSIQVKKALKEGSIGVICGSAIISIIEKYEHNLLKMIDNLSKFVTKMKNATRKI